MSKPAIVSFAAVKGGVGKTRHAILAANCLGACGKKVLLIDTDINNSSTYFYLKKDQIKEAREEKNIYQLLTKEDNDVADFALPTDRQGVDIIASSLSLTDLRSLDVNRLKRMMNRMGGNYDFAIIDCQPDYNNIVLNAVNASDLVITPVQQDMDSFNAAVFLQHKMADEVGKAEQWFITINGYNKVFEDASGGTQKAYIDLYQSKFANITPREAWFPWIGRTDMNEIKDRRLYLTREKSLEIGRICNLKLFDAVFNLVSCWMDDGSEQVRDVVVEFQFDDFRVDEDHAHIVPGALVED